MRMPTFVEVDLQNRLAYVSYSSEPRVSETIDVWHEGQVAADLDDVGAVVGIEVLSLDEETLQHARVFAAERNLAFPANLADALTVT